MLMAPGQHPGNSGTRMLQDNLSDLRAQVAANQKAIHAITIHKVGIKLFNIFIYIYFLFQGIHLVRELIDYYSLRVVQAYMMHVQNNAEVAVREMLIEVAEKHSKQKQLNVELNAEDYMDDGTCIKLRVNVSPKTVYFFHHKFYTGQNSTNFTKNVNFFL